MKSVLVGVEPRARYYSDKRKFVKEFVAYRMNVWKEDFVVYTSKGVKKRVNYAIERNAVKKFTDMANKFWKEEGGKEAESLQDKNGTKKVVKPSTTAVKK